MAAIGKGDWVQCVDDDCDGAYGVTFGGVYCVERVVTDGCCDFCGAGAGLELVNVQTDPDGDRFCICQFRPLGGSAKQRTAPSVRIREDA